MNIDHLPDLNSITAASERLKGKVIATPLLNSTYIDEFVGAKVLFKAENLQRTGSFKLRGAYNALLNIDQRRIVAYSSGNHAQGIALAARELGKSAVIVMPGDAPEMKKREVLRHGGELVFYDRATEDRHNIASKIAADTGAILVPSDYADVVAGQGTCGVEIVGQLTATGVNHVDALISPLSSGGLIAASGLVVKDSFPGIEICGAEPELFNDYQKALLTSSVNPDTANSNAPSVANRVKSDILCDALTSKPGHIALAMNRHQINHVLAVSDADVIKAVRMLLFNLRLMVEPSGAIGLAAVLANADFFKGKTLVIILSGGNLDIEVLRRIIAD